MKEKWCSQMVNEHHHTVGRTGSRLGRHLQRDNEIRLIVDYALTWSRTSQGRSYWSAIHTSFEGSFRR